MSAEKAKQPNRFRGITSDFPLIGRALRLAFTFSGRSSRTEYALFMILGGWVSAIVARTLDAEPFGLTQGYLIAAVIFLVPVPGLMCRRLHDAGVSGWWSAPFLAIAMLALGLGAVNGMETSNLLDNLEALYPQIGGWTYVVGFTAAMFAFALTLFPPRDENSYGHDPRV